MPEIVVSKSDLLHYRSPRQCRPTAVKASNAFLPHNALEARSHALLAACAGGNVSARLNGDVRVGDAGGSELSESAEQEAVACGDLPALLEHLLELLEDGVLQDRVDDQHESRQDTGEETRDAVFTDNLKEGRERVGRFLLLGRSGSLALFGGEDGLAGLLLACRHAGVDHPDGVGDKHSSRASDGAGSHGLEGA